MTPEEPNTAIYHKMEAEQDSYRDWLLTLLPDEILQHAYEYAVRQDILFAMEDLELQPEQCRALMKSPCPVADVLGILKSWSWAIWRPSGTALRAVSTSCCSRKRRCDDALCRRSGH